MTFVSQVRDAVARRQEDGMQYQDAFERLIREHTDLEDDLIPHGVAVLHPVVLVPAEDLRLRCGLHDAIHAADDPELGWLCVAAMARAYRLGISMNAPPDE